mmetsp:Transcript_43818/g.106249  ORF Transcript_43818/g.106249 Transcript_43818/m.106249 type:complete len:369 (+) Transcript_43818:28-1134(+)
MLSSPHSQYNNYNMVKSIIPSVGQGHPACAPSCCSSSPQEPLPSPAAVATTTTTTRNKKRELSCSPLSRSDRNVRSRCWQTKFMGHQSWTTVSVVVVAFCLILTVVPTKVVESFVPGNNNCFGVSQSLSQQDHRHQPDTTTPTATKAKNRRGRIMTFVTNKDDNDNDVQAGGDDDYDGLGNYDPSEGIRPEREVVVGDPQLRVKEKERSVTSILKELAAIQQQGPQKYCILGTRHCSYLHQQIIELLAYALVLSGNHVYTSGAGGTNAAAIKGALRAEVDDLLTVVLPQSMDKQTKESQELLKEVKDVVTMPQNDDMPLDVASRICNSFLLSQTDQLVSFAFHESTTVIEATKEAKELEMLVTTLFLD